MTSNLSNTAVPKYYAQFKDDVISGRVPVCRELALEMNRIDALCADPRYYYDEDAVEGFISFCESELVLTDGSDLRLLDSFKLWAEQVFGWWYYVNRNVYVPNPSGIGGRRRRVKVKKRLTTKQYLIVGRGAAKTLYDLCIQSYFLIVDTSTTHQITVAPTMKQAEEVISPFRTAIARSRGPLFKFLTYGALQNTTGSKALRQKLASTKKGIESFLTGSLLEIRPMSISKLQGLRPKVATVDEWLSVDTREDVIGAIEQGASKLNDFVIIATSSEGTIRNGTGDTTKLELNDILTGKYYAPHVSIFWYKLDDVSEVEYQELWRKANPNIGITVSYEAVQMDVERAEAAPSTRNDILAKRFGIPMAGYTYYFTFEEILLHNRTKYNGQLCSMGMDLSQGDDFCSFGFLFPLKHDRFGTDSISFITDRTFKNLPAGAVSKYQEFIDEGSLIVKEGTVLDMMDVYEDVDAFIGDHDYVVETVGYDPYGADAFVERWITQHSEYGVEKVPQGAKTESIPLGELKALAEDRALIFDDAIMSFAMGNCIVAEDNNGNRKLLKQRYDAKIDPFASIMDAYIAFKKHPDRFEYQ